MRYALTVICLSLLQSATIQGQPTVWQQADVSGESFDGTEVWSFVRNSIGHLYAAADNDGVLRSSDGGENWAYVGIGDDEVLALAIDADDRVLAGSMDGHGVFRTGDGGQTWEHLGLDLLDISALEYAASGKLYAAAGSGFPNVVYRSDDGGPTWAAVSSALAPIWDLHSLENGDLLAATWNGIFLSQDEGENWTLVGMAGIFVSTLVEDGDGTLYAAGAGLHRSIDGGTTWEAIWTDQTILSLSVKSNGDILAGLEEGSGGGVYRSGDQGATWEPSGLDGFEIRAMILDDQDRAIVGTTDSRIDGIFLERQEVVDVCPFTSYMMSTQAHVDAFPEGCSIVRGSMELGGSTDITDLTPLQTLTFIGGHLSIGGNDALTNLDGFSAVDSIGGGLQIWSNGALADLSGLSGVTRVGGPLTIHANPELADLGGLSSLVFLAGGATVYYNGALANLDGLSGITEIQGDLHIGENAVLANVDGLASLTSVAGEVRVEFNNALTNLDGFRSLTQVGGDLSIMFNPLLTECSCGLYEVVSGEGVSGQIYMESNATTGDCANNGADLVSGQCTVVGLEEPLAPVPNEVALYPAYPNPFNPSTVLRFGLPRASDVSLEVYDVTGRLVITLIDGVVPAGRMSLVFDGSGLPSGVYLYRLTTGPYVHTRKMVLLR